MSSYPSQVMMEMPMGDLVNKFAPQSYCFPPSGDCPYMTNQTFHCFDFDSNGVPNYVRGLAQGYWYYSGPVAAEGQTSVLAIYANNPTNHEYALVGSMTIQYSSDFLSAKKIAVTCLPSSWCSLWPNKLVNGIALDNADYSTTTNCLWSPTLTPGGYEALLSKWSASDGTTWMCSDPTTTAITGTNGSWNYINSAPQCASRGESYPCLNNSGPYYNGMGITLPDEAGLLVTQWYGWNFGTQNGNGVVDGRSMFTNPGGAMVTGSYCVYDDSSGTISYCYPEAYTILGPSTGATCATFVDGPTMAPTPMPNNDASSVFFNVPLVILLLLIQALIIAMMH
jgi:hypothetical protein